jgi:hypothetical protein
MDPVTLDSYIDDAMVSELVEFLDPLLKPTPRDGMRGALGYETSEIAAAVGSTIPAIGGYEGTDHEETVARLGQLYLKVRASMEEHFGVEMDLVNCSYQELTKGAGNPMHSDSTKLDGSPWRDDGIEEELEFSALIYLNTWGVDFTGGEIEFPLQNTVIKPKAGQLVFFRGDVEHLHEVKTVESGVRKNLVFFYGRRGNTSKIGHFLKD